MNKNPLSPLLSRAAVKHYDAAKPLTADQLSVLVETARLAPTSFGLQPIKVYVVSDPDTKVKLRAAGYDQPQFSEASHIFIFAARTEITEQDIQKFSARVQAQRNQTAADTAGLEQMVSGSVDGKTTQEQAAWAAKQAYLALGFTLAVAAENKIDATPMEGFDPDQFDAIIGADSEGFHAVVVMAAGFRSETDIYSQLPKVRKSVPEFVTHI